MSRPNFILWPDRCIISQRTYAAYNAFPFKLMPRRLLDRTQLMSTTQSFHQNEMINPKYDQPTLSKYRAHRTTKLSRRYVQCFSRTVPTSRWARSNASSFITDQNGPMPRDRPTTRRGRLVDARAVGLAARPAPRRPTGHASRHRKTASRHCRQPHRSTTNGRLGHIETHRDLAEGTLFVDDDERLPAFEH